MTVDPDRVRQFRESASRGDLQAFEALWLEALETSPTEVQLFLDASEALEIQGNFGKAALFLAILADKLRETGFHREALLALRRIAKISPNDHGLRDKLLASYREVHKDHPALESYLERTGLAAGGEVRAAVKQLENYLTFKPGNYVFHPAGWGAGKVSDVDADALEVVIDFGERPGHRMGMDMAAKVTDPMAADDLRAMKLDRPDQLQTWIEEDPLEIIRAALRVRGGKATLRELRDRLAGPVLEAKSWSRWWQKTRSKIKGAGDLTITPGANPTVELGSESASDYASSCARDLALMTGSAKRVRYFRDVLKESTAHDDGDDAIRRLAAMLVGPDGQAKELAFGERISLTYLLIEAGKKVEGIAVPEPLSFEVLLADPHPVIAALPEIPIAGHRLATATKIEAAHEGDDWPALAVQIMLRGEPDTADHALASLVRAGLEDKAKATLQQISTRPREHPAAFLWYLKLSRMSEKRRPKALSKESDALLLEKAVQLHGELEVANIRSKDAEKVKVGKSLITVFQGKSFIIVRDAFSAATEAEARSLCSQLRNNRSIKPDVKDRMLAEMFRTRPELGKLKEIDAPLTDERSESIAALLDPSVLYCTEKSLMRKRVEYEELVNRLIPENAEEIGRAASYGDLSENAEWSAAIEKQTQLTRQSEELGKAIATARVIDPDSIDLDRAGLGTKVVLQAGDGSNRTYTILGPWEADVEQGVISYQSPLGRAIVGRSEGDTATVDLAAGKTDYMVTSIARDDDALATR